MLVDDHGELRWDPLEEDKMAAEYMCLSCKRNFSIAELIEKVAPAKEMTSVFCECPECHHHMFYPCLHRFDENGICKYCKRPKAPSVGRIIFTKSYRPFIMGGVNAPVGTVIGSYEPVAIGKGYTGMLVRNSERGLWHMALEICGAIIGTDPDKEKLIERVKWDVESGDQDLMDEQAEKGRLMRDSLGAEKILDQREFFSLFRAPEPPQKQTKLF